MFKNWNIFEDWGNSTYVILFSIGAIVEIYNAFRIIKHKDFYENKSWTKRTIVIYFMLAFVFVMFDIFNFFNILSDLNATILGVLLILIILYRCIINKKYLNKFFYDDYIKK